MTALEILKKILKERSLFIISHKVKESIKEKEVSSPEQLDSLVDSECYYKTLLHMYDCEKAGITCFLYSSKYESYSLIPLELVYECRKNVLGETNKVLQ